MNKFAVISCVQVCVMVAEITGLAAWVGRATWAGATQDLGRRHILRVNMDAVIQRDFLGVNAVYHGFAFMPEQVGKGMNDVDRDREFARVEATKLNIARTWYTADFVNGSDWSKPFEWESPYMKAFYAWLKAMKERNVDVAIQIGWWFPGHVRGHITGKELPFEQALPHFTRWVSESLHQLIEMRGFGNIKYGILFTEPHYSDQYRKMAIAVHERLLEDGRRKLIKLVGPNQANSGPDLERVAEDLDQVIDIYSSHTYGPKGYEDWKGAAEGMVKKVAPTGKPFWFDEYGLQDYSIRQKPVYGNYLAQAVAAFLNAGLQTSMLWLLFDQQYTPPHDKVTNSDAFFNGVHRWGTCKWPHDTIENPRQPYPSWYAFSLMSRYLGGRHGTKVYQTVHGGEVVMSAVQRPGGDWSFLVINLGTSASITVKLSRPLRKTLYKYVFDPATIVPTEAAEIIGYSRRIENVGDSFDDELPAKAVAVYSTVAGRKADQIRH